MTEADRILLRVRLAGIQAEERALAEALGDVAGSPVAAPTKPRKAKRDRGPKPPTEAERAESRANLDDAAWARYEQKHGTRRAG